MLFGKRRARIVEALNAASELVETARGPVEFARRGDAPYVLIVHGTPQGHHASAMGAPFEAAGFGTLTPSRPGYLRTPLATGRTPAEQADAMAALLDTLAIEEVAVYAVSGGGPSGIEFAARHPDRTRALILEVAISQRFKPQGSRLMLALFTNPLISELQGELMRRFPRMMVGQMLQVKSSLNATDRARATKQILANPEQLALVQRLVAGGPPIGLLRAGFDNDLSQFGAIERLPLGEIRCPTLVLHGTHDGDVPFAHGEHSAREIQGAELHRVEKGWHLLALSDGAEDYERAKLKFLLRHMGA